MQSERLEKELGRLLCTVNGNSRVLDSDAMLIPIREKKRINHNEVSWLQVNTVQSNNNNFCLYYNVKLDFEKITSGDVHQMLNSPRLLAITIPYNASTILEGTSFDRKPMQACG